MKEEKISAYQVVIIVSGYFTGTYIIINPTVESGQDVWFAVLISIAEAFLLALITAVIAMLHPGKSLVDIILYCFGKTTGRIISIIYFLFAVYITSAVLLSVSNYDNSVSFPETPSLFISICYMIVIAFAVNIGLEVLGRISEVLVLLFIVISFVALVSLVTDFHPDAFLPLFKNGVGKPLLAGLKGGMVPFAEIFFLLNIIPNLNDKKKTFKSINLGVLVAGGILLLFTVRNVSVLGISLAERNVYPSEKVFRLMPDIDIIPLLDINVIFSGFIKVAIALYSEAKILGDIFGLKYFKIYIFPLAALDVAISNALYRDLFSQIYFVTKIEPLIYLVIFLLIPLIILFISLVKDDKKAQKPVKV